MSAILAYIGAAVIALWGVAHAVPTATAATATGSAPGAGVRDWVYRAAAALLLALAVLTGLTGARTKAIWFKICPFLLTGSAALLLAASAI